MKMISKEQYDLLNELSTEVSIPLQILEKDILVTDLLNSLASIQVVHDGFKGNQQQIDTGISLVFADGTCLSKAYGVLNRMSEDIDMKVLLDNNPNLKIGIRGRMKALDSALADIVVQLGFIDSVEVLDKYKTIRNGHKYVAIELPYESRFSAFGALRSSKVKLELSVRTLYLPTNQKNIGTIYQKHLKEPSSTFNLTCINIQETLAEKVLCLLRRCAFYWAELGGLDDSLSRHIYDVHCIVSKYGDNIDSAIKMFPDLLRVELEEFNHHKKLNENPMDTLNTTLANCENSKELIGQYKNKVEPLIYEGYEVAFEVAFSTFKNVATRLIQSLDITNQPLSRVKP